MASISSMTKYIPSDAFRSVRRAIVYAFCIGRPLNYFTTIHVEAAGVDRCQSFRGRVMSRMAEWLARRTGFPACYFWVCENPPADGGGFGGWHVHIVAHVPHEIRKHFRKRLRRWVWASGGVLKRGVLKSKPVEHSAPGDEEELYLRHGVWGLARYLGKGMDPSSAPEFDIDPAFQGVISGKRIGHSEALGFKRRIHPAKLKGKARERRQLVRTACPELLGLPRGAAGRDAT